MQHDNETLENSLNPTILFEDDNYLVIDKPTGLMAHGDGRSADPTLADWVLKQYPDMRDVGEPWTRDDGEVIARPGIVHRLDRDTSGVMVLAKTQEAFGHLKEQFQNREVQKTYNAFVYGQLKEKEGIIDRQIGKSAKDFRLWSAQRGARGTLRDAITDYAVVKESKEASFIEVRPKTGRTHQIRVHMKAVNHPVVCDSRYAPKQKCILGLKRLALHARELSLNTLAGEVLTAMAPLPIDFEQGLSQLP